MMKGLKTLSGNREIKERSNRAGDFLSCDLNSSACPQRSWPSDTDGG